MKNRKHDYFNQEKMVMYSIDQLEQYVQDYKARFFVDVAIVIDTKKLYLVTTASSIKYQQKKQTVIASTITDDLNVNYYLHGKVKHSTQVAVAALIQVQEQIFRARLAREKQIFHYPQV